MTQEVHYNAADVRLRIRNGGHICKHLLLQVPMFSLVIVYAT